MTKHVVSLAILLFFAGCSQPSEDPPVDAGGPDADFTADVGVADVGTDVAVDLGPTSCAFQKDCETGRACVDGTCVPAPGCDDVNDWQRCVQSMTDFGPEYALRAMCGNEGFCHVACLDDGECPEGETCTDYGYCRPFQGNLEAPRPGRGIPGPLRAGTSNVLMNFPIGISMAGYGSRAERGAGRYVELMSDSVGQYYGLYARAVALDSGERQFIIVRLPVIFASASMHEAVAQRLQDATGNDWRDSLVISTTHSHSGPARFWPLPDDAALEAGRLGSDAYHHAAFEWIVGSATDAALTALDGLQPAQFGWEIVESFDTDDAIASDRWSETPPFDDNRLLLMRIDDADGAPLAALISLGMHSTYNGGDYLTGDAAGALERGFETELGERHDRFVPVMYLSENSGTMSPRGDRRGHESLHKHEYLGWEFTQRVADTFDAMETTDNLIIQAQSYYFPISYRRVGYEIGEWARGNAGTYESTFFHGAIQCLPPADEDYATYAEPFNFICLPTHYMSQNRPVTIFRRSIITALRLNDLTVVTMPGENSMEVGWQILREARDRVGVDPAKAFVWGYAQDHQLYISPTNLRGELPTFPGISTPKAPDEYPDFAFSWLQGGYEPSLSVWGHRFGDFMVERAIEALRLLDEPALDVERAYPAQFTPFATDPFGVEPTPPEDVGTIVSPMPATVERLTAVEFGWVGGDPGVEMPQAPEVTLMRRNQAGDFEPVIHANRRPYTNREPLMITRVRRNADRWEWLVYWEETRDFPAGTYRLDVSGHHQVEGARTGYAVSSGEFELVPTDDLIVTTATTATTVAGTIAYPPAEEFRVIGTEEDPGRVTGSFRLRNPNVPTGVADPVVVPDHVDPADVTVTIRDSGGAVWQTFTGAALNLQTSPTGNTLQTTFDVDVTGAPSGYTVEVDVTDRWGNSG